MSTTHVVLFDMLRCTMHTIRVLILSNNPYTSTGLESVLDGETSIQIVGHIGLMSIDLDLVEVYLPDVLLIDLASGNTLDWKGLSMDGIPVVRLVEEDIIRSIPAWTNTLSYRGDIEVLVAALHAAAAGLEFRSARSTDEVDDRSHRVTQIQELTTRETEVLQLVGEGLSNRAIGLKLGIKDSTVKFHVNNILEKMGAQSRTEAYAIAARVGLITY